VRNIEDLALIKSVVIAPLATGSKWRVDLISRVPRELQGGTTVTHDRILASRGVAESLSLSNDTFPTLFKERWANRGNSNINRVSIATLILLLAISCVDDDGRVVTRLHEEITICLSIVDPLPALLPRS
jgi:hypothetical protein